MELRIEARDRHTGAIVHQQKISIHGGRTFQVPQFPGNVEILVSVHPRSFEGNDLYQMLQYGVTTNFMGDLEPADPGELRKSVDYIKGFQEGAQSVIDHAESRLAGFLRYFKNLPLGLNETVAQVLAEWDHFRWRG